MGMLSGTLSDFGLQSLVEYDPKIIFTPSAAGVKGGKLLSTTPVIAPVFSTGAWAVELESTDGVVPDVWYTVAIEHLSKVTGEYTHYDLWGVRLVLPAGDWQIGDLPDTPLAPGSVLVSLAPPPVGYRGWYLNAPGPGQDPGDPNDPASSGTGILEIVS